MAEFKCFECAKPAHHAHHVIPQSLGGTRTVPLCVKCHQKVHRCKLSKSLLVRKGQARARANGRRWGGSKLGVAKKVTADQIQRIVQLKSEGVPIAKIARILMLSRPTIYAHLKESKDWKYVA